MTAFLIVAALLLAGALALLYLPWQEKGAMDRDRLNRALYRSRLEELEQENGAAREALVVDLQRTLLADIPESDTRAPGPLAAGCCCRERWCWSASAAGCSLKPAISARCCSGSRRSATIRPCCSGCKTPPPRRCGWMDRRASAGAAQPAAG